MTSGEIFCQCPHCNKQFSKDQAVNLVIYTATHPFNEINDTYAVRLQCSECDGIFEIHIKEEHYLPFNEAHQLAEKEMFERSFDEAFEQYEYHKKEYEHYKNIVGEPVDETNLKPGTEEAFEKYQYHKKELEYFKKIVGEPIIDEKLITEFEQTEYGNAERLAYKFGQNILYCPPWKNWLIWNDKFWEKDATGEIMRMAKGTVRSISKEANKISDEKKKKELKEHSKKSETKFKLNAMIYLAQSELGLQVKPEDLDKNSWFLNVQNGTIDLQNGQILTHTREHLITKITPIEYNPNATCPAWDSFLNRIMGGNQNLIQYIKRAIGYTLTGDNREQCLFFMYGTGANGKSTFLETIRAMLTGYAQQTDFSTFLNKRESIRNDVAGLQGARFVSGVEAEPGKQFAEGFIKRLTGGDTVKVRFLYQEFFEYEPTFKIFLAANHKPTISGTDPAIWRRIMMIPFTVVIPENERDKGLKDKLKLELSGILNWAVQGCLEWQKFGLMPPKEISRATDEYKAEMDVLGNFIEDCCVITSHSRISKTDFYSAYENWCQKNREQPISKKAFGAKLKERGIEDGKSGNIRYWSGIGLRG
jgi:putative DNA primase/helicase